MWVPVAVWQPCELLYTCYLLTCLLTYFLHLSLSSVILIDSSTGCPVHVLMLSIQAVRSLPRLRAPGVVPCRLGLFKIWHFNKVGSNLYVKLTCYILYYSVNRVILCLKNFCFNLIRFGFLLLLLNMWRRLWIVVDGGSWVSDDQDGCEWMFLLVPAHLGSSSDHGPLNCRVFVYVCANIRVSVFLYTIFVLVIYGRGSVLLSRRNDMLRTSGFTDDVIFAHNQRLLDVAAQLKRSAHAALGLAINCAQ